MARKDLYNPDIEAALLACALADFAVFTANVQPSDFHDGQLGTLWSIGQELVDHGDYADSITLADVCAARGLDIEPRIVRLQAQDVNVTHWSTYAARIKDLAERRAALALTQKQAQVIYGSNGTWKQDIADVGTQLLKHVTVKPTTSTPQRQTSWNAEQLLAATFAEAHMIVTGLIPVGLTFLAGRPKIGKSWLGLQTAIAVSTGGRVLDRQVKQGRVLYLALEDNARRLQERTRKLGMPSTAAIRFELAWPYLTHGGLEQLEQAIANDGYSLVVLDTLGRLLGAADQQDLADMTMYVGQLQVMALEHDAAIVAIDHHKKPSGVGGGDPIDDIIGSTAKSAVADAALGLFRENGQRNVTLKVTGRDVEWQDLVLSWDSVTCSWQCIGTTEEVKLQGRRHDVLAALAQYPTGLTTAEVAAMCDMKDPNVSTILADLQGLGYILPGPKEGKRQPYVLTETGRGVL